MVVGASVEQANPVASRWDESWLRNVLHQRSQLHELLIESRNAIETHDRVRDPEQLLNTIKSN